jgi:hypothetical protein
MTIALERSALPSQFKIYNYRWLDGKPKITPTLPFEHSKNQVTESESSVVSRKIPYFTHPETRGYLLELSKKNLLSIPTINLLLSFEKNLPQNVCLRFKPYNSLENHEKITVNYINKQGNTILFDEVNKIKFPDLLAVINDKVFICEVKTCNGKPTDEPTTSSNFEYKLSKKIGQCDLKFSACGVDNNSKLWEQTLRFVDIYVDPKDSPVVEDILEFLDTKYNVKNRNIIIRVLDKNKIHKLQILNANRPFDQSPATLYQVNCIL